MNLISLKFEPIHQVNLDELHRVRQEFLELKSQCNKPKKLMLTAPRDGQTGKQKAEILFELMLWNRQTDLGVAFDSSTGFNLPNRVQRSPDVSWVTKAKWASLTSEEKQSFVPLCPDFVIELLSSTANLKTAQEKMQDYLNNGCSLAWLINSETREVEIYRSSQKAELLKLSETLSGEDILPGFSLNLNSIL